MARLTCKFNWLRFKSDNAQIHSFLIFVDISVCNYVVLCWWEAGCCPGYHNDLKFSDRLVWANSADINQTAPDQGLHCLEFRLHLLDALLYGKQPCSNFRVITAKIQVSEYLGFLCYLLVFSHFKVSCFTTLPLTAKGELPSWIAALTGDLFIVFLHKHVSADADPIIFESSLYFCWFLEILLSFRLQPINIIIFMKNAAIILIQTHKF